MRNANIDAVFGSLEQRRHSLIEIGIARAATFITCASVGERLQRGFGIERKRHWQRYRLGPRDNWHYERRLIDPIVVNPGHKASPALTIYRLPAPPGAPDQPYAEPPPVEPEPDNRTVDPDNDDT